MKITGRTHINYRLTVLNNHSGFISRLELKLGTSKWTLVDFLITSNIEEINDFFQEKYRLGFNIVKATKTLENERK